MEKCAIATLLAMVLIFAAIAEGDDNESLQSPSGTYIPQVKVPIDIPILQRDNRPALELRSIMVYPEAPAAGEPFDLIVDVANTGEVPFDGTLLAIFRVTKGGSGDADVAISKTFELEELIPPGGEMRLSNKVSGLPEGGYTLIIVLTNGVGEKIVTGGVSSETTLNILPRAPPANAKPAGGQLPPLWLYSLSAILVAALVVAFVVIYYKKLKPGAAAEAARVAAAEAAKGASAESDGKLTELYRKRDEIEEMIKIAKVKYYKRTLDEESYKEIIKDHQQKLIEIEARIAKMEGTIKELQGQIKKGGPTA